MKMKIDSFYEEIILNLFKNEMIRRVETREKLLLSKNEISNALQSRMHIKANLEFLLTNCVEKEYLEIVPATLSTHCEYLYRISVMGLIKIDEALMC